jgi:threonine/homoserine/homoserine lactone efflux protein
MSLEIWIAFAIAAMFVLVIPGPTLILVISKAIAHGRKAVFPLVTGVVLGDLTAMTLSLLGLGAIVAASATLFSVLKWIGAVYLIFLGIKLWRAHPDTHEPFAADEKQHRSLLKNAFIVTALNPRSIAFFVAFLPQFITPHGHPVPQLLLLGATFLVLAAFNATMYAIFAGQLRETIHHPKVRRWFNRSGGTALIGAGILTAMLERSS